MQNFSSQQLQALYGVIKEAFPTHAIEIIGSELHTTLGYTVEDIVSGLSSEAKIKCSAVLPEEYLHIIAHDRDELVRAAVAKRGGATLDLLKDDPKLIVRIEVAKHPEKEILEHLSKCHSPRVRIEVAKHPEKEILEKLLNDENTYVRIEVAKHPIPELLRQLDSDLDLKVIDQARRTRLAHCISLSD